MENTAQLGLNSSPPLMLSDPELFLVSKLHLLPDAECVLRVFSIPALSVSLQARMLSPPPVLVRVNNSFSLLDEEGHNLSYGQGSNFFPSLKGDI